MGLAEGCGGALTCRAPVTARIDAAFEAGGEAAQLGPSSGRRGQEVEIVSGGEGPHTLEPRAYLLQHSLGPRGRLRWCGPESRR